MKIELVQCPALTFGCSALYGHIVKGNTPHETVEIEVSSPQRRNAYVVSYRKADCLFRETFSSDSLDECKKYASKLASDIADGKIEY